MMRVIAGSAKRLRLKTPDGMDTRPTTDRIKETLFNILAPELADCVFLDLFSGSGGIGIEALSRGAGEAVFVEKAPGALACIRENLKFTRLEDRAVVMAGDALDSLRRLEGGRVFDIIFMDPPYGRDLERKALAYLSDSSLADRQTLIICEADKGTDFSFAGEYGFTIDREKVYKTNKHVFLRKTEEETAC